MSKLVDIACTSLMDDINKEINTESWMGTIKLEDDGWFEGVTFEHNGREPKYNFVFGVFFPGKTIELYRMCPIKEHNPYVYHGNIKSELFYTGEFEVIGLLGPEYSGFSEISAFKRKYNEDSITKIDAAIEQCKENLDDTCALFYSRYLEIRKSLCQIFLRNYEGKGFTDEELEEIMTEVGPMNEKVLNDTEREVASLVR